MEENVGSKAKLTSLVFLSLASLLFSLPLPFCINLLSLPLMQAQTGGVRQHSVFRVFLFLSSAVFCVMQAISSIFSFNFLAIVLQ